MKRLIYAVFLCAPSLAFASFEQEEASLIEWFQSHPEEEPQDAVKVQVEEAMFVSNHHLDDADWATDCLQALSFGARGPIPGSFVILATAVVTVGVWPAAVLASAGIAHGLEKLAKKLDVHKQQAEFMTFASHREHDRYLASRLLLLIGGFRVAHEAVNGKKAQALYELYLEWASSVGLPLDDEHRRAVHADTLALRINKEIHKYRPAKNK